METRAPFMIVGAFVIAVILGVFGFVYWLNNAGSIGRRATYHVAFEGPVPGLLTGAAVLFNGIRVGEVTALGLRQDQPRAVAATIAVAFDTPVRKDTKVSLDFQGLTGVPVVALEGGVGTEPLPQESTLAADPGAGQSMTQAARDALRRVDAVLAANAGPLQDAIGHIKVFAEGLARNTPRMDNILAGLDRTMGGGQPAETKVTYDLQPATFKGVRAPMKQQIAVSEPTALARLQTQRLLLPAGDPQHALAGAQWSDSLPAMFYAKLLQSFENYDIDHPAVRADPMQQSGTRLQLDLRTFELDPAKKEVTISVSAKLLDEGSKVVAAKVFGETAVVTDDSAAQAAAAFNTAFEALARNLVTWTAQAL